MNNSASFWLGRGNRIRGILLCLMFSCLPTIKLQTVPPLLFCNIQVLELWFILFKAFFLEGQSQIYCLTSSRSKYNFSTINCFFVLFFLSFLSSFSSSSTLQPKNHYFFHTIKCSYRTPDTSWICTADGAMQMVPSVYSPLTASQRSTREVFHCSSCANLQPVTHTCRYVSECTKTLTPPSPTHPMTKFSQTLQGAGLVPRCRHYSFTAPVFQVSQLHSPKLHSCSLKHPSCRTWNFTTQVHQA